MAPAAAPSIMSDAQLLALYGPTPESEGFGGLNTAQGRLPLRGMDVQAEADGLAARVRLSQRFVNAFEAPLEATYIFPLPPRAAVSRFKVRLRGRIVEGVLEERGKARAMYDQAIAKGHRAAIAEEERPDVFTMRVGNLEPGEEATVELELCQPLAYDNGEVTFRFPLVVAKRYVPGVALPGDSVGDGTASDTDASPDASRVTPPVLLPNFPNPVQLNIALNVRGGALPVRMTTASLPCACTTPDAGGARLVLEPGARLDRDFIVRWQLGDGRLGSALEHVPDADDPTRGTFALTLVPPRDTSGAVRDRDVVFVLDRSGSMNGWKMVAARRAVAEMIDTLGEQDRFNVLAFDDRIDGLGFAASDTLIQASWANRTRALEATRKIEARGGTEMAQPLYQALRMLEATPSSRDAVVILITDGQVSNERQILRHTGRGLKGTRMYTVGIGGSVSEGFLRRLASSGRGHCELVESEKRLDAAMDKLHRLVDNPVLTDLNVQLNGANLKTLTLTPRRSPDLFAGAPVVFSGRYDNARGTLSATATAQQTDHTPWSVSVPSTRAPQDALVKLWARAHVRALEDEFDTMAHFAQSGNVRNQIVADSLRFGVLCRFTAFVAIDRAETIDPDLDDLHKVTQAVEDADAATPNDVDLYAKEIEEAEEADDWGDFDGLSEEVSAPTAMLDFDSLLASAGADERTAALDIDSLSAFGGAPERTGAVTVRSPLAQTLNAPVQARQRSLSGAPRPSAAAAAPAPLSAPAAMSPPMGAPQAQSTGAFESMASPSYGAAPQAPMPPAMSSMPMSPDLESARMAAPQSYGPPRLKRTNTWLFVIMMLLFGVALGLLILFFLMP